ncbi:sporulation-regulated protein 3 [[Candida] railenensis]|uniref:Sporulation-regulated protein 3 n=1 Tax=[Candida] railenensis TaxID=45579 RepID=A0A9P0VXL1_9ASCO|nr:sporulation-regulated protein 3 [[Candida] railenensis]
MSSVEEIGFNISPFEFLKKTISSSPEVTSDNSTLPAKTENQKCQEETGSNKNESEKNKYSIVSSNTKNIGSTNLSKMGLYHVPDQMMKLAHKNGAKFTFMVTGCSGTGKTTFINTLFRETIIPVEDEAYSRKRGISLEPIKIYKAELTEKEFCLKLTIIETPAFGESVNNQFSWSPAEKFIDEQFRLYLYQEEQPDRRNIFDSRVHCCFYFIPPTGKGLSKLDIATMKSISQRTNLIPVISRSDTFTKVGLLSFKELVKKDLRRENIKVCDFILDQSVHEKINETMPFAVIGASSELHQMPDGAKVRGRRYDWGVAETDNPSHCDFSLLSEIVMGQNMLDLILSTESHYENYRKNCLIDRFNAIKILESSTNEEHAQYSSGHQYNGLEELQVFHKYKLKDLEAKIQETDTLYRAKEREAKSKFSQIVQLQERRFKEWKRGLIDRQEKYNKEIENLHLKIIHIQDEIQLLESGNEALESSYKSLSL